MRISKTQSRYNNYIRFAAKVNSLLSQGYLVYDEDEQLARPFVIDPNDGLIYTTSKDGTARFICFATSGIWGYLADDWTVKRQNERFKKWKAVNPKDLFSFF